MTDITAHEDLTQRQSKTARRVLGVHAMVIEFPVGTITGQSHFVGPLGSGTKSDNHKIVGH